MKEYQATLRPIKEFTDTLISDYASILRNELNSRGYKSDHIPDDRQLIIAYITLFNRMVESKPRKLHMAPGLTVGDDIKEGFDFLKSKFEKGEDVNPHLSTLVAKLGKQDKMFFDWGINHFHLGTKLKANGFISRTGPLMYAIVTPDDVFVIDIAEHGHWSDKGLMQTVDEFWPELIKNSLVDGVFEQNFSDKEITELREGNVNPGITLPNGHSYLSTGGGYALDGSWMTAVRGLLDLTNMFHSIHKAKEGNLTITADEDWINSNGTPVEIRLRQDGNKLMLYIPNGNYEEELLRHHHLPQ